MDDDELIAAMAGGDDTALRELFARHAPWLAARLRRMLPAAEVEDVLRESFLAVRRGAGWPARPPHDRGGAICACLVVAAGLVLITVRGARAKMNGSSSLLQAAGWDIHLVFIVAGCTRLATLVPVLPA